MRLWGKKRLHTVQRLVFKHSDRSRDSATAVPTAKVNRALHAERLRERGREKPRRGERVGRRETEREGERVRVKETEREG